MRQKSGSTAPSRQASQLDSQTRLGRRRRLFRGLIGTLVCAAVCIACAPWVITRPLINRWIVDRISLTLPGPIQIGRMELGWLRPPQFYQLQALSHDGTTMVSIPSIRCERPLWRLLTQFRQIGVIHIDQPQLDVLFRPGGSNWEDYLAQLSSGESDDSALQLQLQVHEGLARLQSDGVDDNLVSQIEGWLDIPGDSSKPITFAFQALTSTTGADTDGQIQVQGSWTSPPTDGDDHARGAIQTNFNRLPLGLSRWAQVRFGTTCHVEGAAAGHVKLTVHPHHRWPVDQLHVSLVCSPLRVIPTVDPAATVELDTVDWQLQGEVQGEQFHLHQCRLESSLVSLQLAGNVSAEVLNTVVTSAPADDTQRPTSIASGDVLFDKALALAQTAEFQGSGEFDVAEFSRQLPNSIIPLRHDIRLEAGTLRWNLACESPESQGPMVTGSLQSTDLTARRGTEIIPLNEPVELRFRLGHGPDGPFADHLVLRAPFVQLEAQGRIASGRLHCASDLTKLSERWAQFVELGSIQLSGQLAAVATWESTDARDWQIAANIDGDQLIISNGTDATWNDAQLRLKLAAAGRLRDWRLDSIDSAWLECRAGSDELLARLNSTTDQIHKDSRASIDVRLTGDLARWRDRIAWIVGDLPRVAGQVELEAKTEIGSNSIAFMPLSVDVMDLQLTAANQSIAEPRIEFAGQGQFDWHDRRLLLDSATLASTTVSLKFDGCRSSWGDEIRLEGAGEFRGDLARLWARLDQDSELRPSGIWSGRAQFQAQPDQTSIALTSHIDDLRLQYRIIPSLDRRVAAYVNAWHEPKVELNTSLRWAPVDRLLSIDRLALTSDAADVTMVGSALPLDQMRVNASGVSRLKLATLSERLRRWIGPEIRAQGAVEQPFAISGPLISSRETKTANVQFAAENQQDSMPLVPAELKAEFGVGWQHLQAYGIQGGASSLRARLDQQTIRFQRFQIPVSQGQLNLAPQIELRGPVRLRLEKGPVLENLNITPEMCHGWLKYIAPIVADATTGEGQFSLQVAQATVPLMSPRQADVQGSVRIHRAYLGPGPLTREILAVAQTIRAVVEPGSSGGGSDPRGRWIVLPEQAFPFRIDDRRVSHRNLTMEVGDVTIRTRGWVGFNQQMGLIAEIPVRDRWIARRPELSGLKGQTLRLPIRGELGSPRLDQQAMGALTQQAVRGAAEGLIRQQLQRQLEELLPAD